MRISCLGGVDLDTKAHLAAPVRLGTSNPAAMTRTPGGVASNVARSLARLGVPVVLCSLVGDDEQAAALRADLVATGVDISGVSIDPSRRTAGYVAVLDPDGSLVLGVADMGIFDEIGVLPVQSRGDPMLIGRICRRESGYHTPSLSFLISWWIDTRAL